MGEVVWIAMRTTHLLRLLRPSSEESRLDALKGQVPRESCPPAAGAHYRDCEPFAGPATPTRCRRFVVGTTGHRATPAGHRFAPTGREARVWRLAGTGRSPASYSKGIAPSALPVSKDVGSCPYGPTAPQPT